MPFYCNIQSFIYGLLFLVLGLAVNSCVSSFEADIVDEPDLISIEASLIKGELEQSVLVSKTSPLISSAFIPVSGCDVSLLDEQETVYHYIEKTAGKYFIDIPDEALIQGRHYKIRVITAQGNVYESDYEMLNAGIEVDSVYYGVEDKVDVRTGEPYSGVQFYLDVKAGEDESRYFRWRLSEIYEYSSFGPISYYYMDETHEPIYPEDEFAVYTCWKGEDVSGLYQSSTMNLIDNEKKRIHLNYVSALSERLRIKYSLLVDQFTLNENAYNYFEQNRIATEEADGLYTRQPRQPITNFQNVDDAEERVLGYFWVSTKTSRRIFVPRIDEMVVQPESCAYWEYSELEDGEGPFPIYLYEDKAKDKKYVSSITCFDCTRRGGTNVKPDYWE